MKIYGKNSKGKKVLITVPDWDDPALYNESVKLTTNNYNTVDPRTIVNSNGAGGVNSSASGSIS